MSAQLQQLYAVLKLSCELCFRTLTVSLEEMLGSGTVTKQWIFNAIAFLLIALAWQWMESDIWFTPESGNVNEARVR